MTEAPKPEKDKRKFQAIKGVRDILPPESALWNRVEQAAREVFASYNFAEIRLPIFEQTELFVRSIGEETEVVDKEMYWMEGARADLLQLRARIQSYVISAPDASSAGYGSPAYFRELLHDFMNGLDDELVSGEVEFNEGEKRAYEHFRNGVAHFQNLLAESSGDNFAIARAFRNLKQVAGDIQLGSLSLRPEATASVCRAYIEHGMQTLPGDVKLYYIGPMFRRERPQKGRYRQFYQIGAEVLGQSDAPAIDAEVIEMLLTFFSRVGLSGATLYINSIGCKECRPKYVEILREALRKVKEQLGADSQRRIETNPLRVLDSKVPNEQTIIEKLPRIAEHLCEECRDKFAKLQTELKLRSITYEINWRLVRGLDYYVRTTFEITAPGLGSQNAVCGGGRYDGLVELLGGPPTKGIGFAIGTDRLILSLQESGKLKPEARVDVFIAWMGEKSNPAAVRLAKKLREASLAVELPPEELKFKKSLSLADKLGARFALIIGEDEIASGQLTLKRLSDGEQRKLPESELISAVKSSR